MEHDFAVASVLLDVGIDKPLDYAIEEEQRRSMCLGMRVEVPLRGTLKQGTVVALKEKPSTPKILPISSLLEESALTDDLFQLAMWMANYYLTPLRKIVKSFLPTQVRKEGYHPQKQAFVKLKATAETIRQTIQDIRESNPSQVAILECLLQNRRGLFLTQLLEQTGVSRSPVETLVKKKLLSLSEVCIDRSPLVGEEYFKTSAKTLNDEQEEALKDYSSSLENHEFAPYLLYGITGSGKTEVYLQAIEKALTLGRSTIMLVPEISLTEQTIRRLKGRFENEIAILHHRLSHGERHDQWHRIRRGEVKIVVGARSALFSPVHNLGLIIVDEEHDSAYKQSDERPTYHARDMAVMRGKLTNSVVVLGSATPSIESMYNVKQGKYRLSQLNARATNASLPEVKIVDMLKEYERAGGYTLFSELLIEQLKERLDRGEQSILFLNRRGYHTSLNCGLCGETVSCPHCDLAMTFHRGEDKLTCHLCSHTLSPPPKKCPSCKAESEMKFRGVGTEQVERSLHALLGECRTLRIDSDTTRHKGSHDKLLRDFRTGKADILIGTQMIAKGLHFPSVTLVAILNADSSLNLPDFRASEQTFQLITQVAGRAGRGELKGEVIIQSRLPDNEIIGLASQQDYDAFYEMEVASRKCFDYPPFSHLIKCGFSGEDETHTQNVAMAFRDSLIAKLPKHCYLYPVGPAGYAKINGRYRFQFLIRCPRVSDVTSVLKKMESPQTARFHLDIDAISTFF